MDRDQFQRLVVGAVEGLPEEFRSQLHNLDVVVEDRPTMVQVGKARLGRGQTLLGLYEGVPQTRRGRSYGLVLPDKITVFQQPIEARCRTDGQVREEVRRVVEHEIAHHFGISDRRLAELRREAD